VRRLLSLFVILALAGSATVMTPQPAVAATPFSDISDSKFKSDIDWAYNNGITVGCSDTKFCPKGLVTRDQMASFLARMFKLPATTRNYFTDDNGNRHEQAINRVAAAGITVGCDAGKYCPKGVVTRAQMASFIARADDLSTGGGRDYFWDDNGNRHEANIDRFAAAGITTGCGDYKFCPNGSVTREQMAAFLHRVVAPRSAAPYPAPPPPEPEPTGCHPAYVGYCVTMGIGDWDCAGGSGNGPNYLPVMVRVVGHDEYDLDHNSDGYGCESLG